MSNTHSNIEVKNNASREQLEQILDILGKGFSVGRAFFQERIDHDPTFDPANTWFATVDQVIASSVQIFPMSLRIDQDIIRVGGMGSVCTDENYQGMGLATRILQEQTKYMKQQGYHLSMLLASKHSFYNRSGWYLLSEPIYYLNNEAYQNNKEVVQDTAEANYVVIPFDSCHLPQMSQLYDTFNKHRTGSYVRNESYWKSLIQWPTWREAECLTLWQDEKLIAYGIIAHTKHEQAILREFIYDPQKSTIADVLPLFNALCQLRPDAKVILAKLPKDHLLYKHFQESGATTEKINIAMWKMINCEALFNDLLPQLQNRLKNNDKLAGQQFKFALETEHDRIVFSFKQSNLQIAVQSKRDQANQSQAQQIAVNGIDEQAIATIETSEITLIKWLLYGFDAADEKSVCENEAEQSAAIDMILSALFPEQNYAFYITDYY